MSSIADIMDAEETVDWFEQRSAAVAEWSSRTLGKKERWETDRTGETSVLEPRGSDAFTTTIEPSSVQVRRILDLKNEDKGESPPKANSYPSHNPRYTKTKERPVRIQQPMNAEMMMTRARDRDTRTPSSEGKFSAQICGDDDQHGGGKDHQPHDKPDGGAALVDDTGVLPVR